MFLVTSKEMKKIDEICVKKIGISEKILMENAGKSAACYFFKLFSNGDKKSIGIFAGKGNNGGDSFVMARYLVQKGFCVRIFLLSKKNQVKSKASKDNLNIITKLKIPIFEIYNKSLFNDLMSKSILEKHDVWIDAIFGIGIINNVSGHYKLIIDFLNKTRKPIFSIDIPSGINSDSGQICGTCVKACYTITFAYPKIGLFVYPGNNFVGKLKIADIGIPEKIVNEIDCKNRLLDFIHVEKGFVARKNYSHKGMNGHLVIIAGSNGKTGAAIMTSMSAMRAGTGLVTLCIPKTLNPIFETSLIEVITCGLPDNPPGIINKTAYDFISPLLNNKKCVVFGPGIGVTSETFIVLEQLIENSLLPIVIDADGITLISKSINLLKKKKSPIVLTPHIKEMSRLTNLNVDEIKKNKIAIAKKFSIDFDVHIVLKGDNTVITHPNGKVYINTTGNSGMASAGMGDVLTGIIAAFITQGYKISFAIRLAVFTHGLAADFLAAKKGVYGYLATDVINCIPIQIDKIYKKKRIKPNYLCDDLT